MQTPKKPDPIAESLGLEPLNNFAKVGDILPAIKAEKNKDYEYARNNLYNIIEKGQNALDDIIDIAKQSESARAFEVVTNLIKTMTDANKDLLSLAKAQKELEKDSDTPDKQITNNNLFVGSSTELLKMIKNNQNATE